MASKTGTQWDFLKFRRVKWSARRKFGFKQIYSLAHEMNERKTLLIRSNRSKHSVPTPVQLKFRKLLSALFDVEHGFQLIIAPNLDAFRHRSRLDASVGINDTHAPDERPLGPFRKLRKVP